MNPLFKEQLQDITGKLSIPLLVVIWLYPEQGILCGWSSRLRQSTTGHSFGTYIINVQKHAQDVCSLVPTSLTNRFQSMSGKHCTAPL